MRTINHILIVSVMAVITAHAAEVNYTGAADGSLIAAGNWETGAYPTREDVAILNTTANLDNWVPNDILSIRIGLKGKGVLNVLEGASFEALANSGWDSRVGSDKGGDGTWNQTGGEVQINFIEIGRGGKGLVDLKGGKMIICRGRAGYSVYLGTDDTKGVGGGDGTLRVSGGAFLTRTGVYLGAPEGKAKGTFWVQGSGSEQIGIGSQNTGSGTWLQNRGSVLKLGVDEGGVTKILVDKVDDEPTSVIFEAGSLLDVEFSGNNLGEGSWVVLEVEGADIQDKGLKFADGVNTATWSFRVDNSGDDGKLIIESAATPLGFI